MKQGWTERTAAILLGLYALDRISKLTAVVQFFGRHAPPTPPIWPSLTLIQPVTVGTTALGANLDSRFNATYAGRLDHVLICDAGDELSIQICRDAIASSPAANVRLIIVATTSIAPKPIKLEAGLAHAHGEIICSIDDDIALRPDALAVLVQHLLEPGVGAVFGLAAYRWWRDIPSSLMSLFVNHNALMSYIPLVYLAEPWTITGHCYAVRRTTLEQVGSFRGMEHYLDDDHDLARRIRALGLRNVQTPVIYDVRNALPTMSAYRAQMKRWSVIPRQTMLPHMTPRERWISTIASGGMFVPGTLALLAVVTRRRAAFRAMVGSLMLATGVQWLLEVRYVQSHTPAHRWLLFPLVALVTPFQIIAALLSDDVIEWRGQRLEVHRGGLFVRHEDHPRS